MTLLCWYFRHLARQTWEMIDRSRQVPYQLKEETLTDFNMLSLMELRSPSIRIEPFNKYEEGQNGADWEWWFTNGAQWIGFRVQAKVINIKNDNFEHLHYQGRASIPQSEKLILQAEFPESNETPRIPIYCLFLNSDQLRHEELKVDKELYGCSILSAYKVKEMRPDKKNSMDDLQEFIFPWHELVCSRNSLDAFSGLLSKTRKNLIKSDGNEVSIERYLTADPPNYVQSVQQGEYFFFERQQGVSLPAGVAVISLRA